MNAFKVDLALCLAVMLVLTVVVTADEAPDRPLTVWAYLWPVALGLLMLVRRDHALLVLALTTLGFFTYYAAGFPAIGVGVPIAAALFSAAEMGHVRAAAWTGTAIIAVATAFRLAVGQDPMYVLGFELAMHVSLVAAVIALGHNLRIGRRLRRRTEQVTRLLDLQTEMETRARLREQHLRLAREMHDSIGHSLSVVALYTDVAREACDDTERRTEALARVRTAASEAHRELRDAVAVLRGRGTAPVDAPGLGDLPGLVATPAAAGYDVDLDIDEVRAAPDVEAAAYRVVQEAITNTLRHSSGTRIRVRVGEAAPGVLSVGVFDDGSGSASPQIRPGHGLAGMRERVTGLGGTVAIDSGPDGWRVQAAIPTGAAS